MPFLVNTGLFVIGDMVVIVSTDILPDLWGKFVSVVEFKVGLEQQKSLQWAVSDVPRQNYKGMGPRLIKPWTRDGILVQKSSSKFNQKL